jgi:predicted nuclease of predicted toxin-antitoxin system
VSACRLYLDEDVYPELAARLRDRGIDSVSVHELGRTGLPDPIQLDHATSEGRALVTFNVAHFAQLARERTSRGESHGGVIVSSQLKLGEVLRRLLRLQSARSSESLKDDLVWLSDYR